MSRNLGLFYALYVFRSFAIVHGEDFVFVFQLQAYVEEEKSPYSDVISYSTTSDKRLAAIKPMLVGKASSKSFKITWGEL